MGYYDFAPYVPVAKKKEKARKKLEQLRQKDKNIAPVIIAGNKIAKSWWGVAWNKNLESYADLKNRIQRGSAYVKNGFVLDLRVNEGEIMALVYGSSLYKIFIKIDKLSTKTWADITKKCAKSVGGMAELAEGKFPQELSDVFMKQGHGLFPSPKEITFSCDCPDQYGTHMCKHIAASLYGVGARLDTDPLLFFRLRGVDPSELIRRSVNEKMQSLLANAGKISGRVIDDGDVARLFGF